MAPGRRGFTLLEVLVVAAILVLLLGIVYAAAGPAREKARRVVCASNLRQIHRGLMMCCEDYGGVEPDGFMTATALGLPPCSQWAGTAAAAC